MTKTYFPSPSENAEKVAKCTKYISPSENIWWLRSPGLNSQYVALVWSDGTIHEKDGYTTAYGVRPAGTVSSDGTVIEDIQLDRVGINGVMVPIVGTKAGYNLKPLTPANAGYTIYEAVWTCMEDICGYVAGLLGDVNKGGKVNQKDVARLRQYIADPKTYPLG